MNTHRIQLHGRCPYAPMWDYYTLEVRTEQFVRCEDIEHIVDKVRGTERTQEDIAEVIKAELPDHCTLTLIGRHGNCGELVITK